jgi:hypothetical protein
MRVRTILNRWAALALLVALVPLPAFADEPVETAVKAWVSAIDQSPDWRAGYAGLVVDPATEKATLTGLTVASERPGITLTLDAVDIDGYRATSDGTFAAREIDIAGGSLKTSFVSVALPKARIDAVVLPMSGGGAWDDGQPTLSLLRFLAPLAGVRAASVLADSLVLTETIDTIESTTTYTQVRLTGWGDGKISLLQSGPLDAQSPANDPLVATSATSSETHDLDLGAILHAFDPAEYANGVGDMAWRQAVGSAAYHDVTLKIPSVALTIGDATLDDVRLRQTRQPPTWTTAAAGTGTPTELPDALLKSLEDLSGYGIGALTLHDLNVRAEGLDHLQLGDLSLKDFSLDRIGEFALSDGVAALSGHGSFQFGRIAFGGLVPPSLETVRAAVQAEKDGGDVDMSALAPQLGFVELGKTAVTIVDGPSLSVDHYRLDLKDYVGTVPTTISLALGGADIPVDLVPEPRLAAFLHRFGYERVNVDAGADIAWRGDTIGVTSYHFAMKDLAAVSGNATLTGLTPADAGHLHSSDEALAKLSLTGGSLTFKDDSIIGRSLDEQAKRLNTDPVKFRQQFAVGLPFMLTFLGNPDLQKQLAPVLQSLIRSAGSLTAVATPAAPIALTTLMASIETSPFALLGQLGLKFSGTTGASPPAGSTVPATPPPAN